MEVWRSEIGGVGMSVVREDRGGDYVEGEQLLFWRLILSPSGAVLKPIRHRHTKFLRNSTFRVVMLWFNPNPSYKGESKLCCIIWSSLESQRWNEREIIRTEMNSHCFEFGSWWW